jgi:hypothetical protein
VALAVLIPTQALAKDSAVIRSLLLPGTGQAHQGNYTKAAIFAGAAIISGAGLLVSQIHYNQAVDKFDAANSTYQSLAAELNSGGIVGVGEIETTYQDMLTASDEADTRLKWRNIFLTTLIATYTLNLIDVWISKPHDPETAMRYGIEANRERVLLVRSFRF